VIAIIAVQLVFLRQIATRSNRQSRSRSGRGGTIGMESEQGAGTLVRLFLPRFAPGANRRGAAERRHASRLVEDDFAAATAALLNKLSLDGTIEHLVVVSDPRTLGRCASTSTAT
jgi:protein required for attachment to host cells